MTTLSSQALADLVVTAFEGGSNHWLERVTDAHGNPLPSPEAYSVADAYKYDFCFMITEEDGEPRAFNNAGVETACRLMMEGYTRAWARVLIEQYDADDADLFLQLALFGDVVYG